MFMQDATRFAFDTATAVAPPLAGLTAGTLVDTTEGWRVAEALRIGMGVYTAEGGIRPILAVDRRVLDAGTMIVRLPGGSFDNCAAMDVLPDQLMVLEQPDGAPLQVAARSLAGRRGARLVRLERACQCVTPLFAEDEVIWANSGTRLFCAGIATSAPLVSASLPYLSGMLRKAST